MAFFGVAAVSQMLWLNFAPLVTFLEDKYQVSELAVSSLLLSFPLLYVLLSIHSGVLIDKKGYKYVIALGSIISSVFACMRIFDNSFTVLLIGQTGIAIGQPYIINGISKLVSDWFSKEHTAMATGIGTAGLMIGMAIGMGLTPALNDSIGFHATMIFFAALSWALTLLFIFLAKENHLDKTVAAAMGSLEELKQLLRIRNLVVIFVLAFLAIGFFNGLTTWIEPILKPNGINSEEAGIVGAFLILGGIVGSVIIPSLSDKYGVRKPFLVVCCMVALAILYPLCTMKSLTVVYALAGLMGFFFLPGYALLLSMCEELAGSNKAGAATGLLMLAGNAGAVIVIVLMPMINSKSDNWINSVYLMIAVMTLTLITAWGGLRETFPGTNTGIKLEE